MKKKLFGTLFLLSVIGFAFGIVPAFACHKEAIIAYDQDRDGIVETGELCIWHITVVVANTGDEGIPTHTWTNTIVTDRFGAELELVKDNPSYPITYDRGPLTFETQGGSNQLRLTWNVGSLAPYERVQADFYVQTDLNPAGHREYTSPGQYIMNSGATVKCIVDGHQASLTMNPIQITVFTPN